MKNPKLLTYKELQQTLKSSKLGFKSTKEIKTYVNFVGQERALKALEFGVKIHSQGYNLYAMGPTGVGKRSLVTLVLNTLGKKQPTPPDYCYIYNFNSPEKPIALQFPAGLGIRFQQDMKNFLEEAASSILAVFESENYRRGIKKITKFFDAQRKLDSPQPDDKIPAFYKEKHEKENALEYKLTFSIIQPMVNKLKKKYRKFPNVVTYLNETQIDILKNITDFISKDDETNLFTLTLENPALTKYKVNLLVDNSKLKGAPIIFEETPTYQNLISRIEHTSQHGSLVTNFTLIRAGSLHKANGGYLIIDANKITSNREAWEALKSALYFEQIKPEPIKHIRDSISPVSLEPTPIALNVKIILLGDRNTYYCLCDGDKDFLELFKVAVDFEEYIDRNKKNVLLYTKFIAMIVKKHSLKPFLAAAVAEIINYSTRIAHDIKKLSIHISQIKDLVLESDFWAGVNHKKYVDALDVKNAIQAKINRMDRSKDLYYEDILRNFIIIKTEGKAIGQVNCLSVRKVGNFSYGHPTRVTARVRGGKGKIIDIQREIKMAGPLHTKAGLIISNFLASRFNQDHSFSLFASLSFEQIYCWTDGDSASIGELCALLSALAKVPILQSLAVTGSIDQYGVAQAIGGVNEKIEGFYDVCNAKGLTGTQGVIIPTVNKQNLMLRDDIVKAAKEKKFFIYTVDTIDEAVSLLTGMPAGKRNRNGKFPENTLYYKIEKRLELFSKTIIKKILL